MKIMQDWKKGDKIQYFDSIGKLIKKPYMVSLGGRGQIFYVKVKWNSGETTSLPVMMNMKVD